MCDLPTEVLTREDCESILHNYSKGKEWKLTSYTIDSLSDTIEGLVGEHYIVKIQFQTENGESNQKFFVKILNGKSEVIFELSKSLNAYEKEEFFYNYLQAEFAKESIDTSYAPESYLCKPFKIVLEDLSIRKFSNAGKKEFFDLAHCQAALRTLAKFHSTSIIYERNKSISLLEKFPQHFEEKLFARNENSAAKWLKCSIQGLLELIVHLNIPQQTKTKFNNNLNTLYKNAYDIIKPSGKRLNTILHGDLWTNNLLFSYKNKNPTECIIIDFQMLNFGSPALDVAQMILTNTRKKFRQQHYLSLLDFYYENFKDYLSKYRIDADEIMSKKHFLDACDEVQVVAKLQAIADRSITFLSEETYADALADEELFKKFLFEDRSKFIVKYFLEEIKFRELIEEDMLELYEMLLKYNFKL